MEFRGQKRILLSKSTHTDSCVHGLAYVHQKLLLCGWNVTCKHHFVVVILMQRHDLLPFIVHKIRSLPQNNRRWHEMTSTVIVYIRKYKNDTCVHLLEIKEKDWQYSGHRKEPLLGLRNLISAMAVIMDWLISRSRENILTSFEIFRLHKIMTTCLFQNNYTIPCSHSRDCCL